MMNLQGWFRSFALLILASCFITTASRAQHYEDTAWKIIAGDGSFATSTCIGSNATLDCLIDTAAACSAWSEATERLMASITGLLPACEAAEGVYLADGIFSRPAPSQTLLQLYRVETSRLESVEEWTLNRDTWEMAAIGDVVVDYYTMTCGPSRKDCQWDRAIGKPLPTDCQPDVCEANYYNKFYPIDVENAQGERVKVLGHHPTFTLLMRETAQGWIVVDWYLEILEYHGSYGAGPFWLPPRWRAPCPLSAAADQFTGECVNGDSPAGR